MGGVKAELRKLKYRLKHDYFSVENVVLVVAVLMCLTWTYQSIEAMSRNWTLTEKLNAEQRSLELVKVEVEAAELENEYYQTDEYQELMARKLAGKQLPGEKMVYMPENSEAAKNKHQETVVAVEEAETKEYSNPEKWLMYLLPSR